MESRLNNEDIMRIKLVSKFFKGFADYSRICIFESLMDGEKTVSEIVDFTGFSQSKISNHLKCLRESDLVNYSIYDEKIKLILNTARKMIENISEEKYNCMKY